MNRLLVSCVALVTSAPVARGDLIEFVFSGKISSVIPLEGPLESVSTGDSFTMRYVYESTALDANLSPTMGSYALTSYSLDVGTSSVAGTIGSIQINASDPDVQFAVSSLSDDYHFFLDAMTVTPLLTDSLPTTLDFDGGTFEIQSLLGAEGGGAAVGDVAFFSSRIVPLPGAFYLGIVGLGLVGWIGRKTR